MESRSVDERLDGLELNEKKNINKAFEQLLSLGWNVGEIQVDSSGVSVVLYERPFHTAAEGVRHLHLSGASDSAAIEAFLDEDIEVRAVQRRGAGELREGESAAVICVEPVRPLPGEENDQWLVFRRGDAAISFDSVLEASTTFWIKRREARLANVDSNGRRVT